MPSLVFDFAEHGNMQALMEQYVETFEAQTVVALDLGLTRQSLADGGLASMAKHSTAGSYSQETKAEGQFWFKGKQGKTLFGKRQPLDTPGGKLDFWLSDLVPKSVILPGEFVRPKTGSVLFIQSPNSSLLLLFIIGCSLFRASQLTYSNPHV
jgi:hypothetical protein